MTRTEELLGRCDGANIYPAFHFQDIKQLVELVRLQNTTIGILRLKTDLKYGVPYADEAIAAFNRFEGGE